LTASAAAVEPGLPDRRLIVTALGVTQILAWGSSFYLLGVLANPIARDTGWPYEWVMGGVSVGLLTAGAVSPRVGRAIGQRGGRAILAGGAVLLGLGLLLIGLAQSFVWYLAAWLLIGAGMGAGLYDAAFSTLGSIYGKESRSAITWVTLFGGFASTVCWPLSAVLVEQLGWRGACFVYAAIHLGFALPLYLLTLPRRSFIATATSDPGASAHPARLTAAEWPVFVLLAAVVTVAAAILSMVGTHLLPLLQARGVELAAAVALGTIVGPAQVGARVVEMFAGRHYPPIWTMIASTVLMAIGTFLLFAGIPIYAIAIVLYGAGNGIGTVARGTLPIWLFGPERYPALMGRLGLPILMSMALAPFLGAVVIRLGGPDVALALLAALAAANVLLTGALWRVSRHAREAA
jgi:predicted MFS family arabinose efflux permease